MPQKKSKKNKILIFVIVVIVFVFMGYSLFFNKDNSDLALVLLPDSHQDQAARELLVLFAELSTINLNPAVLNNPVFASFEDFSRNIPDEPIGRANPFAPI